MLSLLLIAQFAKSQLENKSMFYLIVANEHYSIDFEKFQEGFTGLTNLEEAASSAVYMENIFRQWGAKKGVVLKSSEQRKISTKDIFDSLNQLLKAIKISKVANPCVLFYYAGHGFSSKKLEALYLPNGDFTRNKDSLSMEDWENYSTVALDLHEKLQAAKLPHFMFFDCCYSGTQEKPERLTKDEVQNFGLEVMDRLMGDSYNLLTAMFRMVGPDPVIFSTTAGGSVPTLPLNDSLKSDYVAPLCRRILLINKSTNLSPLSSTKEWMNIMLNKSFDLPTATAVSYWVPEEK